jgi:hypothetical protein
VKGSKLSKLILGGVGFEWVQTRVAGPLHQPFHCFRVYTSASAIIIAFSQAKSFLGYSITRFSKIIPFIESIYAGCSQVMMLSFTLPSILIGTSRSGVADYTILLSHYMT